MRVLLIDDDHLTAEQLEALCRQNDIRFETAGNAANGLQMAQLDDFDLILMDLILPDDDGHQLIAKLRAKKVKVPVIVLTGYPDPDRKAEIQTFNIGADDFVAKPYHPDVLLSKMRAVVRRSRGYANTIISAGGLNVNVEGLMVDYMGIPIPLPRREFDILKYLIQRKGKVVTKDMLYNYLYDGEDAVDQNVVESHVSKLRKKLAQVSGGKEFIHSRRFQGYWFRDPLELEDRLVKPRMTQVLHA